MALQLTVNGEARTFDPQPQPAGLMQVIEALGHNPSLVVVEHNGAIVPRRRWPDCIVLDGDNLEIVTIVGGGS